MDPMDPSLAIESLSRVTNELKNYDCAAFRAGHCSLGAECPRLHRALIVADSGSTPFNTDPGQLFLGSGSTHDPPPPLGLPRRLSRKKNPCFQFESHGTCRWGDDCHYAHSAPLLQGSKNRATNKAAAGPTLTKDEQAEMALHIRAKLEEVLQNRNKAPMLSGSNGVPQVIPNSIRKSQNPCFAWEKGHCAKGDLCQYRHDVQVRLNNSGEQPQPAPDPLEQERKLQEQAATFRERLRACIGAGKASATSSEVGRSKTPTTELLEVELIQQKQEVERVRMEVQQQIASTFGRTEAQGVPRQASVRHTPSQIHQDQVERKKQIGYHIASAEGNWEEVEAGCTGKAESIGKTKAKEPKLLEFSPGLGDHRFGTRQDGNRILPVSVKQKEVARKKEEKDRKKKEKVDREECRRAKEKEDKERQRAEQERLRREREQRKAQDRAEAERAHLELEAKKRELAETKKRQKEAAATIQAVVGGSTLVTFTAGFEIKNVIPGFDLCTIVVRNFPSNATKRDVSRVFQQDLQLDAREFHITGLFPDNTTKKATVLTRTENAVKIEERALEGISFLDRLLEFQLGANAIWGRMASLEGRDEPNTLTIQWSSPSKTVILIYSTMEEAKAKAQELDGTLLLGRRIKAKMNTQPTGAAARYFVEESVKVTNIDMAFQMNQLSEIGGTDRTRELDKSGLSYDLPTCISTLETRLYGSPGAIPGSFQTASLKGDRMQAKIRFTSNEAAQQTLKAIESGQFGQKPPFRAFQNQEHQFTINIPQPQYESQRPLWNDLAEGSKATGAFVQVYENKSSGRVFIKVLGSNQREVGALKVRVESLVIGERLGGSFWHSTFLEDSEGVNFLSRIKDSTGAFASVDKRTQALRLCGVDSTRAAAKEAIREEVERLNSLEWSSPLQRELVAFFVRSGLKTLQDALGEENVSLNLSVQPPIVKIKGGDDARHHLRKLMDKATELLRSGLAAPPRTEGGETCPICYDEVSSPDTLSCGHTYCEGCLRHYLISAADSKKFPLVCMGDEATCGQPVAIPIIQRYLTPQRVSQLVDAAFLFYLGQNARTYKYCPTPDCSQIYRCDQTKDLHRCPSCFFQICGRCDEEVHEGMRCEEARVQRNPAEQDRLNEEWIQSNNAKRCPECRVIIVKGEGCNHISCRCGAHICWTCLRVFSADAVYDHMHKEHGGIHEPQPAPPNPAADEARRLQAREQEEADRRYAERLQEQERLEAA